MMCRRSSCWSRRSGVSRPPPVTGVRAAFATASSAIAIPSTNRSRSAGSVKYPRSIWGGAFGSSDVTRTGADDHLAGFDHLASDEFDPDCGAAAHEHPLHVRVAADRQVGAIARGVQVAEGRAHTTAVDGIDRKGTDAHRTWRVVVGD